MATIVTRIGKGEPLSIVEGDANFTNLNDDKIELTDISVGSPAAPDGFGSLSYNNTTGVFTFTPPDGGNFIVLSDISVNTAATGETSALSYNNTTGVFTFTPVETSDLIDLTDISINTLTNSGSGSLSYNNTTGVFTFTPADLGDKLSNIVEDTTPQLSGNLDLQGNTITTSSVNGNIELAPNGTGLVIANNLRVTGGSISVDTVDTSLNLQPGSGTAAVNIMGDTGLQIAGDGVDAVIFTATTNSNLLFSANGTGIIGFNNSIFIENNPITTSITNGDISVTPTGTGKLKVATGVDLVGGTVTTSTVDGDITITGNGDGSIVLDGFVSIGTLDSYSEGIDVLAGVSGTLTVDPTAGPIKYVIPSGNITINGFSSPVGGQTVSFVIDQSTNETNFTITVGAGILFPGGTAPTLTALGNDLLTITCLDDENGLYIATFVADFQ